MKKIIASLVLTLTFPAIALAFTPATLYKDSSRIAVYSQTQAQTLFGQGYKLETKNIGLAAPTGTVGIKWVQSQPYTLAGSGASLAATTIILKSFKNIDGTLLTMANFGNQGFGTLEPGNTTNEEQITFTGVTQNANGTATLTGVKRVSNIYPYTETSGIAITHSGGTKFVLSNTAGFYNTFANKENDEVIDGTYTFMNFPLMPTSTPVNPASAVNKAYADLLVGTSTFWLPSGSDIYNANIGNVGIGSVPAAGYKLYVLANPTTANTFGIYSSPRNTAVSTVTNVYAYLAQPTNSGIAPNVYGYYTDWNNSGTTTNRYGMYIENGTGSGTTTNNYGLYIQNQTKGTSTNYAIYSNGPDTFTGTTTINNLNAATTTFTVFPSTPNSYPTASTSVTNKGYVDRLFPASGVATTSSYACFAFADTSKSTTSASYVKMKEIAINSGFGTITVSFDLSSDDSNLAYGRIYVNGIARGTERSNISVNTTYIENISVNASDLVQIYAKKTVSGNAIVKDFRLYKGGDVTINLD